MAKTFVRQDIWKLEQQQSQHPVTRAYASAIAVMKSRPADDPTSLRYQAAIHGGTVEDKFRNQCQHATWFFLSWHRIYLYWFEQIVRKIIQGLPDVDDETKQTWALPYWDYWDPRRPNAPETTPFVDRLPLPFREPAAATNPLFVSRRDATINGGERIERRLTWPERALRVIEFSGQPANVAVSGFGGPPVGLHHTFDGPNGALEVTPHGSVHVAVGGGDDPGEPVGFMSHPNTAGFDPIFYLHHSNIDRLWQSWLERGDGRENPTSANWLDEKFHFHNADGNEVTNTARNIEQLIDYEYADVSAPAGPLEAPPMTRRPEPDHPAELVGATAEPMELTGRTEAARFGISRPAGPLSEAGGDPSRVYLNVEDVRAERNPGLSYAVYVNAPDDDEHEDPTEDVHYVGNLTFFGIELAQDLDRDHPGGHGGMRFAFDITDLYTRLRDAGLWDEDQITVTLEPVRSSRAATLSAADLAAPPVTIGRVSIFYQ
jgi:tyrosinase